MKGRRSPKTREQRISDLQVAINRSSLTGLEVLQVLVDWLKWQRITVTISDGIKQEILRSIP